MAFDKDQIKDLIIRVITAQELYSESAVNLLLGTMAVESDFGTFLYQKPSRIAKGIFQMESATERDIWNNYLFYGRTSKRQAIYRISGVRSYENNGALEWNIAYGICIVRLFYRRVKELFPLCDNIEELARYWKTYYNTLAGSGTIDNFIYKYNRYVIS